MKEIYGTKLGMTRVFTEAGESVPVTVIEIQPNVVTQVKNVEKDGYAALQIGFGEQKPQRVNRAMAGHYSAAKKGTPRHLREIRIDSGDSFAELKVGEELKLEGLFEPGKWVDVSGITIGKGFAGVMKRHGMKGYPMTRGTHEYRRHGGSIGCRKFPGRVFPNKRMGGHMGVDVETVLNLQIVSIRENLILVKGSVPGPKNGVVRVREAIKA